MERGVVKWFDEEKGYGFIHSDTQKEDFFVHRSNIVNMEGVLEKGQLVEFEIGEGKGGRSMAVNVRALQKEQA